MNKAAFLLLAVIPVPLGRPGSVWPLAGPALLIW